MDEFFIVPTSRGFEVWRRAANGAVSPIHSFPTESSAEAFAEYRRQLLAREVGAATPAAPGRRTWRSDKGPDEAA